MTLSINDLLQRAAFTRSAILYRHEEVSVCLFPTDRCREIGFSAADAEGVSTGSVARSDDPQTILSLFAAVAGCADPSGEHAAPSFVKGSHERIVEWIDHAIESL